MSRGSRSPRALAPAAPIAGAARSPSSTRPRSPAATASPTCAAPAARRPTRPPPQPSELGYPVVVKVDNVAHKARVGGVALNLTDAAGVREAAERMGGRVIVAEQASGGVEVLVGAVRDPDYGATVVVGLGGALAEQLDLVTASLAPLDDAGAAPADREPAGARAAAGRRAAAVPGRRGRGRLAAHRRAPRDRRDRRQPAAGVAAAGGRARLPDRARRQVTPKETE